MRMEFTESMKLLFPGLTGFFVVTEVAIISGQNVQNFLKPPGSIVPTKRIRRYFLGAITIRDMYCWEIPVTVALASLFFESDAVSVSFQLLPLLLSY